MATVCHLLRQLEQHIQRSQQQNTPVSSATDIDINSSHRRCIKAVANGPEVALMLAGEQNPWQNHCLHAGRLGRVHT